MPIERTMERIPNWKQMVLSSLQVRGFMPFRIDHAGRLSKAAFEPGRRLRGRA
jgi:hypothetical protein